MKIQNLIFMVVFVFVFAMVLMPVQMHAQRIIPVINPSFEKPDSGKIEGFMGKTTHTGSGFKVLVVPGWSVDAPDSSVFDSGIEKKATSDGQYDCFLMGGDSAIYQTLWRRLAADDSIQLGVDARNSWQGTKLKMQIYYLDGDSAKAPRVPIVTDVKTVGNMARQFIVFGASQVPAAIGHRLGILFDNVAPDSASWLEMDNVQLLNLNPTIIEVPNYSFELPDSGKIEGWNGPGSCPKIADSQADIPDWTSDTVKVADSGIEHPWNPQVDGAYSGFLMGGDTCVWNLTNHIIQAHEQYKLRVTIRNNYNCDMFHLELYYQDTVNQMRITLAAGDSLYSSSDWREVSLLANADDDAGSIGYKLGISFDNVSTFSNSWMGLDEVKLNLTSPITGFSNPTPGIAKEYTLSQNYPNPFNPTTNITFTMGNKGKVRLSVYDILGREVAVLVNEVRVAGKHTVTFSANNLSSGVYFYKLQAAGTTISKKMMLMK